MFIFNTPNPFIILIKVNPLYRTWEIYDVRVYGIFMIFDLHVENSHYICLIDDENDVYMPWINCLVMYVSYILIICIMGLWNLEKLEIGGWIAGKHISCILVCDDSRRPWWWVGRHCYKGGKHARGSWKVSAKLTGAFPNRQRGWQSPLWVTTVMAERGMTIT